MPAASATPIATASQAPATQPPAAQATAARQPRRPRPPFSRPHNLPPLQSRRPRPLQPHAPAGLAGNVNLQLVAQGLTAPVYLVSPPDNSGRLFVVDQVGLVRVIGPDGSLLDTPFLDLRDRMVSLDASYDERGLLGLAFHPDYAHNGRFFVYYSAPLRQGGPDGWDNTIHLSEFKVSKRSKPGRRRAASASFCRSTSPSPTMRAARWSSARTATYISGWVTVAARVTMTWGTAPGGNGQDTNVLLGKILRINVDGGQPYAIPGGQPVRRTAAAPRKYMPTVSVTRTASHSTGPAATSLFVGDVGPEPVRRGRYRDQGRQLWLEHPRRLPLLRPQQPVFAARELPVNRCTRGAADQPDPRTESQQAALPSSAAMSTAAALRRAWPETTCSASGPLPYSPPSGRLFAATPPATGGQAWPVRELSVARGKLGHNLLGFGQDGQGEIYLLVSDNFGTVRVIWQSLQDRWRRIDPHLRPQSRHQPNITHKGY